MNKSVMETSFLSFLSLLFHEVCQEAMIKMKVKPEKVVVVI